MKRLHLKPDLIFPLQKIRGTSLPWSCANWTQNIWIAQSIRLRSPINPMISRKNEPYFPKLLLNVARSLNAKIGSIKNTNPVYIIVARSRTTISNVKINSGHQNSVIWNHTRVQSMHRIDIHASKQCVKLTSDFYLDFFSVNFSYSLFCDLCYSILVPGKPTKVQLTHLCKQMTVPHIWMNFKVLKLINKTKF